ncbi:MAG TPA: Mut7-C RNAse domain-containing protein [Candidatus Binatia bacterium]
MSDNEIRFAADRMLGRLAKWLRILGCDVSYGRHLSGHGLIRAARADGRLILTRDRSLARKHPPPFLFIESDDYVEQLRQVLRACDLRPGTGLFSRCLVCNSQLQRRAKESVEKLVPPYVFATQERFSWCGRCRKLYWPATHQQKMLDALGKITVA